jgi:hypothetical protein
MNVLGRVLGKRGEVYPHGYDPHQLYDTYYVKDQIRQMTTFETNKKWGSLLGSRAL